MAVKNYQVTDQTIKGAVVGAVAYALAKWNIDPELQAAVVPVIIGVLAWTSTKVGNHSVASFLDKAAEETPDVVTKATKKAAAKKK
jgi:hypothetical protein